MELHITNHGVKKYPIIDQRMERNDRKRSDKTSKKPAQESITVNTTPIKISTQDKKKTKQNKTKIKHKTKQK